MQCPQAQMGSYCPYQNQQQQYQHFNAFGQVPPQFSRSNIIMDSTIGEGEVVPVHNPDGSRHFYFIPRLLYAQLQNLRPCNIQPCMCTPWSYPGQCGQNLQKWIITSISDPDAESSTTDLHYFFPQVCSSPWLRKPSASVQATPPDYQVPYCSCNNQEAIEAETRDSRATRLLQDDLTFSGIPMC